MILPDGHVVSHALRSKMNPRSKTNYGRNSLVKARIDAVIYPDNEKNSTFNSDYKFVEYECTIVGGAEDGKKLFNVRDSNGGSQYNNVQMIRSPTTNAEVSSSSEQSSTYPNVSNGSFVLIQRLYGNGDAPVITGSYPNPMQSGYPTEDDGIHFSYTFNGVTIGIDKNGAFSVSFGGGPKDRDGNPQNESAAGSSFTIDQNGNMTFSNGAGQSFTMNRENNTILIGADGNSIEINTSTGAVTLNNSGVFSLSATGQMTFESSGVGTFKGSLVQIQEGGMPAARMGDQCIGTGNMGAPVISTIMQGSGTCLIGG
jgi:uncharacterized Zn-binding protein involved in type VI secretion